jgi:hypothetical protein
MTPNLSQRAEKLIKRYPGLPEPYPALLANVFSLALRQTREEALEEGNAEDIIQLHKIIDEEKRKALESNEAWCKRWQDTRRVALEEAMKVARQTGDHFMERADRCCGDEDKLREIDRALGCKEVFDKLADLASGSEPQERKCGCEHCQKVQAWRDLGSK